MKRGQIFLVLIIWGLLLSGCHRAPPADADLTYDGILGKAQAYVEQSGTQDGTAAEHVSSEMQQYGFDGEYFEYGDVYQERYPLAKWWLKNSTCGGRVYPHFSFMELHVGETDLVPHRWEIYYYYTWDDPLFQAYLDTPSAPNRQYLTDLGDGWYLYAEDTYAEG